MAFTVNVNKVNGENVTNFAISITAGMMVGPMKSIDGLTTGAALIYVNDPENAANNRSLPLVVEYELVETLAAVQASMTTDEAEAGAELHANKATTFDTINDTLYPSVESVVDSFQPIWFFAATGTNTYAATLTGVVPTAYYAGMRIRVTFENANTTGVTINVNALGAKAVTKTVSTALVAGDLIVGKVYELVYDGTRFQILGEVGGNNRYALTTGIADVSVAAVSFPTAAYTTGLPFYVKFNITNATTTPTLNVNGLGAKTIVKGADGATALSASDLVVTKIYTLIYDGTNLQINI